MDTVNSGYAEINETIPSQFKKEFPEKLTAKPGLIPCKRL